ncbi:M13 family metallopeptidase [Massilia sp. H-1]|nr:M13 family metallopeptidase [Massilia sp. H-1]
MTDAEARAGRIADLETRIARTHASTAASGDLAKAAPLWRRADFKTRAPGLDWDAYFDAAGLPARQPIGAWQPDAIKGIAALVAAAPLQDWQDYLQYHALNMNARFLPKAFSDRYFAFYDPIFIGPSLHRPFWDHVVTQTNTDMPGAKASCSPNAISRPRQKKRGRHGARDRRRLRCPHRHARLAVMRFYCAQTGARQTERDGHRHRPSRCMAQQRRTRRARRRRLRQCAAGAGI